VQRVAVWVRGTDGAGVRARTPNAVAFVERVEDAVGDVVVVGGDVRLGPGWLEGLLAARGDDGTVATVDAVVLDVVDVAEAAARLQGAPARPRPRTSAPTWACTLVTRAALDLAGPLDDGFAGRCSARGLLHVVAGDVLVAREGKPPEPPDEPEPARRARRRAQALAEGLSVTVDARILRDPIAGTQVHTLELLAALHRTRRVRLRALVPPNPTPTAAALLSTLHGLELLDSDSVDDATSATAIVHRPYQVTSAIDLLTLRQVGERLVVTHQDLLTYHVPAYHRDHDTWREHRRLTRTALDAAHAVVAFSQHAGADLRAEELVTGDRLEVVPIGVDHALGALAAEPRRPVAADALDDAPYLLCLGTDLLHKNRTFAIELAGALREHHGWSGKLALAGSHVAHGSSQAEEAALLTRRPELAEAVVDLGVPDEAEKAWLYAHAAAAVYPTLYEGFGLVPFEAATHGTPCLFAAQASLAETLRSQATLSPWDAAASAGRTLTLLSAGPARDAHVAAVRAAAAPLTWDATAAALLDVYAKALGASPAGTSWAGLEAEAARGHWEGMYWALRNGVGATGLALVGEDGTLPADAQRTLAALSRRPLTRRPLLAALRAIGRVADRSP
jgi:glycosyltransferase involved in cell wall biosynthesis